MDANIFNKILVNQIQENVKRITHHCQVGFISGWFNICKSIHVIIILIKDKNDMIISTDVEKHLTKYNTLS